VKFYAATAQFEAETRRAVSSSILALLCHIMHQNVENDVIYHCANRDMDMTLALY
jgi:hypothetical protein